MDEIPTLLGDHHIGLPQDAQMLRDGGRRNPQAGCQRVDAQRPFFQQQHDLHARFHGQRLKNIGNLLRIKHWYAI